MEESTREAGGVEHRESVRAVEAEAALDVARRVRQVTQPITFEEARAVVAGRTEKPFGTDPVLHLSKDHPGRSYRRGLVPLDLFADNESGSRYDSTVDEARARGYASRASEAPPVIAAEPRRGGKLRILDGGHRLSAARLRGDALRDAIVWMRDGVAPDAQALPDDQAAPRERPKG